MKDDLMDRLYDRINERNALQNRIHNEMFWIEHRQNILEILVRHKAITTDDMIIEWDKIDNDIKEIYTKK